MLMPIVHRNTIAFHGMAERSFYLAFKHFGSNFYALDKANTLSCWCALTGKLKSSVYLNDADYRDFEVDRAVYDKGWRPYTVLYR
jgi:hypothetical protein